MFTAPPKPRMTTLVALVLAWAIILATGGAASASSLPTRGPGAALRRGRLVSATGLQRLSRSSVASELAGARLAPGDPALGARAVRDGIAAYRVVYDTVTAAGRQTRASGLVVFPASAANKLRVVIYGHGTSGTKVDAPSSFGLDARQDGIEGRWSSELFGSAGFAVAEPDYLGMGQGPGRPEYMVAKSEASATLDLLRAATVVAARQHHQLDPGVLVTGFSEGGAAAMAFAQRLSSNPHTGFRVRALAPVSGPYDLSRAQLPGMFNGQVATAVAPYYIGYTLTAWNPLYHLYTSPSAAFRAPYAAKIAALFSGRYQDAKIAAALPANLAGLLTPRFLGLLRHPTGAFHRSLVINDTCTGWTPHAPVHLYAARGDTVVTELNAQRCQRIIRAHAGHSHIIELGNVTHDVTDFIALPRILGWFMDLR